MHFFTNKALPNGNRAIVDMISGETVAEYKTGNQESFNSAHEVARQQRVDLLADLAGAGLIVDDGRQYALPVLQQAFQKFLNL